MHTNYRQFMSRFLQFTLRLGSKSVLSTCKAPDQPGEGVLLHYSYDNGITWKLLEHYSYLNYHEPRYVGKHLEKWEDDISFLRKSLFKWYKSLDIFALRDGKDKDWCLLQWKTSKLHSCNLFALLTSGNLKKLILIFWNVYLGEICLRKKKIINTFFPFSTLVQTIR